MFYIPRRSMRKEGICSLLWDVLSNIKCCSGNSYSWHKLITNSVVVNSAHSELLVVAFNILPCVPIRRILSTRKLNMLQQFGAYHHPTLWLPQEVEFCNLKWWIESSNGSCNDKICYYCYLARFDHNVKTNSKRNYRMASNSTSEIICVYFYIFINNIKPSDSICTNCFNIL